MLRALVRIGQKGSGKFTSFEFSCPSLERLIGASVQHRVVGFQVIEEEQKQLCLDEANPASDIDEQIVDVAVGAWRRFETTPEGNGSAENGMLEGVTVADVEKEIIHRAQESGLDVVVDELWVLKKLDGQYLQSTSDEGAPSAIMFFSEDEAEKAAEYQRRIFDIVSAPVRLTVQ